MDFIVKDQCSLNILLSKKIKPKGDIKLKLPHMNPVQAEKWEKALNRHYDACGCEEGAVFTLLAFIGVVLFGFFGEAISFNSVMWSVGVVFGSAIIGKIIGLLYSFIRVRLVLNELAEFSELKPITADANAAIA